MEVCGPLIYIGYGDCVIRVWKDGICKGRYQGHMGEVRCFPALDHQLLTNRGYMFLDEVCVFVLCVCVCETKKKRCSQKRVVDRCCER
jgi:hypothetical protein